MRDWWTDLRGAIGFLTILPVGSGFAFRPERMGCFFPVVGLLLGIVVAGVDAVVRSLWPEPVAALMVILSLVLLTGALHVDGLADAGDGLFSHRSREQVLAIMKDSRVGVMGVVCMVSVLALKWGAVWALDGNRFLALILVPAYSRLGMLSGMQWLPYGRPEGGTGAGFCVPSSMGRKFWSAGLLVPLSLILGWQGAGLNLVFVMSCAGILLMYSRIIGCITGDTLGAMNEVLETVLFLYLAAQV